MSKVRRDAATITPNWDATVEGAARGAPAGQGAAASSRVPDLGEGTGVAAGGEEKPLRRRNTAGKTFLHGADRTVRFYKPTEAELTRLGELSKDEANARGACGFCVGILVNVVLGLVFAAGLSPGSKAAAVAIGVCAAGGAIKFWLDARTKRRDGNSALDQVKKDHDFANI